jgi:hypothetical protein
LFTRRIRWRELLVFVAYLIGAIVFTYPLIRDLRRFVTDHYDPLLDAWALAWVAHQLPLDPVHLFDSNRFYPEVGTLAFNDPMIGMGILVAPVQWAFQEAVLTLNVAMLFSLALSGYGAYRLASRLTGSETAGGVAGAVFAFNAYRLSHLSHVQLQAAGFIPLLYLCISRYLEEGRLRFAVGVGVFLWFVSASCAYYGVFTWILLAVVIPYESLRTSALKRPRRLVGLTLALALSALAYLPLAMPFMRIEREFGFHRPLNRLQRASARPGDYLRSGAHLHQAIGLKPKSRGRTLFPGLLAVGVGLLAIVKLNRRTGLYLIIGALAAWMSLGPAWGLYRVLHGVVPGLSGVRSPPRIGIYVLLAAAILASQGAAILLRRFQGKKSYAIAAVLVVFPLVESFGGPAPYTSAPDTPAVYRWLAAVPDPVPIVELPLHEVKHQTRNAVYLYWSTSHFKPLANGYGTFVPPVYGELVREMRDFPDDRGVATLRRFGFRYVILHRNLYLRFQAAQLEGRMNAQLGLRKIYRTRYETVYEVVEAGR